jgi:DNA-binding MarR family transcriptional regulator
MKQALSGRFAGKFVIALPCACANLRRAARIITQLYDQELRPTGLRTTQFTLLQALTQAGNIAQGTLGDMLGLDSTTLTRTLVLLRRRGWIQASRGEDRRQIRLALTAKGAQEYRRAYPFWKTAQRKLRAKLGEAKRKQIMDATIGAVTAIARI